MEYYSKSLILELISPIVAAGDVNTSSRTLPVAGGFRISDEVFNSLCDMGQSNGLMRLGKYYKLPLQSYPELSEDISTWDEISRGMIINYITSRILQTIGDYTFVATGELKTKTIVDSYRENVKALEDTLFLLDQNNGQVYPALDGLLWRDLYITRQQNKGVYVGLPNNTKYQRYLASSNLLFKGLVNGGWIDR